jgi:dihydroorotase
MLSDTALADFRTFCRLSPPLRQEDDRKAVIAAIGDGTIDVAPAATTRAAPRTSACPSPTPNPAWRAPKRCCR